MVITVEWWFQKTTVICRGILTLEKVGNAEYNHGMPITQAPVANVIKIPR
jgi:hypothetical protein